MSILDMVREAGVIGAGGAGFPTHAKLASKAEYILLNGAECEPLLRVDQQLMRMFPDEIIKGFESAGKLVGANKALIGIKGKHKEVISILRNRIEELQVGDFIEVKEIPDIYPAGDEQVLVHELTGRVVPEMGIPISVGCVVVNAETALNIYHASMGVPVTEKYITVAGDIPKRLTVKVPVGTPVIDVLKLSGIENFDDYTVIDGGPMMGPVKSDVDGYVTKKNKGFVILKKDHPLIRKKSVSIEQAKRVNRSSCEQCRMCTDMCPRYLLGHSTQPHKMMRALNYALKNVEEQKIAQLCCQCNLCELFSCPAGLYPKSANLYFKGKLAEQNIKYKPMKSEFTTRKSREYRLVPSKRLIARLGLHDFDRPAPMTEVQVNPEEVHIATRQHVGAPAVPIVNVGDHVELGQQIGKIPEGSLSAAIHASISGTVVECGNDFIVIRRG
ncbi:MULTISPECIES: 4Fe-4S dicluster domain-containing protein [Clostridium]|uniref:Electron transport complex protein RnfC n=3 Tax=Clostridium TaxID=1485 RepID=D8GIC7_CLOLD|nr:MULTISPECIES: 4Fe-4S dicluster domain-containing protein [Clostridium]ADK17001.1 putative RnfC related NADH dehydrogenase [Clostridium ljungdahlii DSM 13528]AGY76042.1 4Fe-4S dicluster domain-containing protein [Clostridium autoethanogenum DSM 10061]ALU36205.1 Respiratory-chain NADH dehydrogenase domain subunit A [Clostridium autoethanogenum DSM 10061]OAA86313.1 Electron transport complex protein RnfC [Clostridium ljungdahlii DSM 13528]OVY51737.1 Electron transport complex protein RnfC [Clo